MTKETLKSPFVSSPATPCRQPRRTTIPPPFEQRRSSGILSAILRDAPLAVQKALDEDCFCAHLPLSVGSRTFETPLCVALQSGASPQTIELLLKCGADPNQCGSEGRPPLMTVAMSRPLFEKAVARDEANTHSVLARGAETPFWLPDGGKSRVRAETCPAFHDIDPFDDLLDAEGSPGLPPLPGNMQSKMYEHQGFDQLPLPSNELLCAATTSRHRCFSTIPSTEGQGVQEKQRCQMTEAYCCSVAEVLLGYRADVFYHDVDGLTSSDHASQNGRSEFVALLAGWVDSQK
jgi:hypothetical protein